MFIASTTMFVVLGFYLVLIVGGIFLQIYLSKRESKWPGLILPIIAFCFGFLPVFNVVAFGQLGGWELFAILAILFLVANIPTFVLLGIYFACREKKKRKAQLDKMNIQDLE